MKQKAIILLLAMLPLLGHAQLGGLMKKVKNKATQKIDQRMDSKIDKAIDQSLDEMEGKSDNTEKNTTSKPNQNSPTNNGWNNSSTYDFIPGTKIVYAEDFTKEVIGELPLNWNTNGSGEVVQPANTTGNWLRLHNPFQYLSANTSIFPENYTAEFDLVLQLKNNGWMYPTFSIGFFATNGTSPTANNFLKETETYAAIKATLYPEENNNSRVLLESFEEGKIYFKSDAKNYGDLQNFYGKPIHIAIQVQKERFRMWMNASKIFDVPKAMAVKYAMNQLFFRVGQTNYAEEQYGIFISNIKVATGVADTRHQLMEEGKFSTTGILFDVNSANIQPASYGVIKEIGAVLKANPSVKIKIVGHTSNDGDADANMELSKRRAAAVKEALINQQGIDASMIETAGKGETQPVANNNTKEGKAQNRRVEFIKLP